MDAQNQSQPPSNHSPQATRQNLHVPGSGLPVSGPASGAYTPSRDYESELGDNHAHLTTKGEAVTLTSSWEFYLGAHVHDRQELARRLSGDHVLVTFSGSLNSDSGGDLTEEALISDAERLEFTSNVQDLLREKRLAELNQTGRLQDNRKGSPYFYNSKDIFEVPRNHEHGEFPMFAGARQFDDSTWTTMSRRVSPSDESIPFTELLEMLERFPIDNEFPETDALISGSAPTTVHWATKDEASPHSSTSYYRGNHRSLQRSYSKIQLNADSSESFENVNLCGTCIDTQQEVHMQEMLVKSWPWPAITVTSEMDMRKLLSRADWKRIMRTVDTPKNAASDWKLPGIWSKYGNTEYK